MQRDLSQALERLKVRERSDLNYDDYLSLKTDVTLVGLDMATGEQKGAGQGGLGFVFSIFMLTFVMVYGMHVMRGVIEEKSNRIVEVVLSTVRPGQLLAGKIAGIGLVGLTQIVGWAVLSWVLLAVLGVAVEQSAWMESWTATQGLAAGTADFQAVLAAEEELAFLLDINWGVMLGCGALYFVLGYAMYAAFFATIGAMVEQESDAQYLMLPVMMPLLFSYILASMSIDAPESTLAVVSSFIPFSSPVSMMVRLPMGVPWWHVVLSMSLLAVTAIVLVALAARVYRVAILMYGKSPTLREVVRWMVRPDSGAL
jgi:ABC-2 type transport system permease protein